MFDNDFREKIKIDNTKKQWYNLTIDQMRNISDLICFDFWIKPCYIYFVDTVPVKDALAIYIDLSDCKCVLTKSKSIFVLLHELGHHVDSQMYNHYDYDFMHGKGFDNAIRRITTWANKNICDVFEPFMFKTFYIGRNE